MCVRGYWIKLAIFFPNSMSQIDGLFFSINLVVAQILTDTATLPYKSDAIF